MSKFTAGLNPEQRAAVEATRGPLLVLAGAGTGKTRVITHRIAHMLAHGVPASSILAMTFTNKAAGEMKERIAKLAGRKRTEALTVGTFHAFCVKSLRQYGDRVGVRKAFGICDADDQLVAMKQALRELQIPETQIQPKTCLSRVSLLKNQLISAEQCAASSDDWEADIGRAYRRYDESLLASGLLDFDDLLLFMVRLLEDTRTLTEFQKRYKYLLIDEYQDTNGPQYEIVKRIGGKHRNVCVVGDDDQSIYGWRGADVTKILNFEQDFPEAKIVRLETNYRSTAEIIKGANAVIRNNKSRHEKALRAAAGTGDAIVTRKLRDEEMEALFVVQDILHRASEDREPLGEFAILFRTQVQPRLFELQLRQHYVPYNLVGGMSFFDRKEVRDILAFLRLVANPADELSLLRIINTPPRGIGATTVKNALAIAAKQRMPLSEVFARGIEFKELQPNAVREAARLIESLKSLQHLASGSGLVELVKRLVREVRYADEIKRCYSDAATRSKRWEAVNEIMNMAEIHAHHGSEADLTSFLEDVTLNANDDRDEEQTSKDRVTLMTLHSAKGLEFGQVYLVGMEEGILPHIRCIQDGDIDEERRLAYVGITRAKRRLTISYTASRARYGDRLNSLPSRFLYEMLGKKPPAQLIEKAGKALSAAVGGNGKKPAAKKKPPTRNRSKSR